MIIRGITVRNFLSVGNVVQALTLNDPGVTLVLGDNADTGGRNGAGKSTILQAVSFALFGKPLTNIKADNLVNNKNTKGMLVTIDFEKDGKRYRIERGRKPLILKFWVNDTLRDLTSDESQGDSRKTQEEIERILGISHVMFRHIVALNTFNVPFLMMKAADQRAVIEELLGITLISQKAEHLKELIRDTKDAIKEEEFRIKAQAESNQRIQKAIDDLEFQHKNWENQHARTLNTIVQDIERLQQVDIDAEIAAHAQRQEWQQTRKELTTLLRERQTSQAAQDRERQRLAASLSKGRRDMASFDAKVCPTCAQALPGVVDAASHLRDEIQRWANDERSLAEAAPALAQEVAAVEEALAEMQQAPTTVYDDLSKAYEHRNRLAMLQERSEREARAVSPYREQIDTLRAEGLQQIDYEVLNDCTDLLKHQEFLLKLLTSKDSFVRKKIIDHNLSYLNHRLNHYLDLMALPHEVRFKSDLTVEITELGRDYDFEQLSRGEMNRVNMATSWSFRDVWQSLNQRINLIFCDEILDQGTDSQGIDATVAILKNFARHGHSVFLISHRDELVSSTDRILTVKKQNDFSHFHTDEIIQEAA